MRRRGAAPRAGIKGYCCLKIALRSRVVMATATAADGAGDEAAVVTPMFCYIKL